MAVDGFTLTRWETEDGVHEMATREGKGSATELVGSYTGYEEWSSTLTRREVARAGISLVLAFGDPLEVSYSASETGDTMGSFVVGVHTQPALTTFSGHQCGVQVDLTFAGASALLGLQVNELTDRVVPLDDVLGRRGRALVERLAEAPSWSRRFDLLDSAMSAAGQRRSVAPTPNVEWLVHQLARHPTARVEELMDETGWSRRHLREQFTQQIGVSPKTLARLFRFQEGVRLLGSRSSGTSLAEIAVAAGYYDQAHFNRDFRAFAGYMPTQFLAEAPTDRDIRFVQDEDLMPP